MKQYYRIVWTAEKIRRKFKSCKDKNGGIMLLSKCAVCDSKKLKFIKQQEARGLLRYYTTFKVRKFEWLFYKINKCLQKNTTCIRLWVEQIFLVNK